MERYKHCMDLVMRVRENGEYVRYDEHAAELATLRDENAVMRDRLENVVIAYGMGWDMDGVIEAASEALK